MAEIILQPSMSDILIENGLPSPAFYLWIEQITIAVSPPATGSGSPEGVVTSGTGKWYVDIDAAVGTGVYFKESGDGSAGWQKRS